MDVIGQAVMLDPDRTVAEVLQAYPQAERAFFQLATDCVGCYLMSFCSLGEVADQYELPLQAVLQAVTNAIADKPQSHAQSIITSNKE